MVNDLNGNNVWQKLSFFLVTVLLAIIGYLIVGKFATIDDRIKILEERYYNLRK